MKFMLDYDKAIIANKWILLKVLLLLLSSEMRQFGGIIEVGTKDETLEFLLLIICKLYAKR